MKNRSIELGGYFDLSIETHREFYCNKTNCLRLNSGRSGLILAVRNYGCSKVLIPSYLCDSVKETFIKNGIRVEEYNISDKFIPLITNKDKKTAIVVVKYYGIYPNNKEMKKIVFNNINVIIDNTQSFFSKPIMSVFNIYSPRKFFGVPDGGYLIGKSLDNNLYYDLDIDNSGETSNYILSRIDSGCNNNYNAFLLNEKRIADNGVKKMSELTKYLLKIQNYQNCVRKRIENFNYLNSKLASINELRINNIAEKESVPMVYPLLIKNDTLRKKMIKNSIYVSQWWKCVIDNSAANSYEKYLSRYLLPLPIDHRYGKKEMSVIAKIVLETVR